jgi:F5/8 type C domain.
VLSYQGWSSGVPQQPGMWLQVELPAPVRLTEIQYTPGLGVTSRPGGFSVQVSADGATWTTPVAEAAAPDSPGPVVLTFDPVAARFVRVHLGRGRRRPVVDAIAAILRGV